MKSIHHQVLATIAGGNRDHPTDNPLVLIGNVILDSGHYHAILVLGNVVINPGATLDALVVAPSGNVVFG